MRNRLKLMSKSLYLLLFLVILAILYRPILLARASCRVSAVPMCADGLCGRLERERRKLFGKLRCRVCCCDVGLKRSIGHNIGTTSTNQRATGMDTE